MFPPGIAIHRAAMPLTTEDVMEFFSSASAAAVAFIAVVTVVGFFLALWLGKRSWLIIGSMWIGASVAVLLPKHGLWFFREPILAHSSITWGTSLHAVLAACILGLILSVIRKIGSLGS